MLASSPAERVVSAVPAEVDRATSATLLMFPVISVAPCAALDTERAISFVVAVCSSTADAIVAWRSLI